MLILHKMISLSYLKGSTVEDTQVQYFAPTLRHRKYGLYESCSSDCVLDNIKSDVQANCLRIEVLLVVI